MEPSHSQSLSLLTVAAESPQSCGRSLPARITLPVGFPVIHLLGEIRGGLADSFVLTSLRIIPCEHSMAVL